MTRKRWTQQTEVTNHLLNIRQKKKWQIALRRYVIERQKSLQYAPYFGLNIESFRSWIELQFDEEMTWENFSEKWQLDHIVPVACFDFNKEEDLKLCWNFINIRPSRLGDERTIGSRPDVLTAKTYYHQLHQKTGLPQCGRMVAKIESLEKESAQVNLGIEAFLKTHQEAIEAMSTYSTDDFERLNTGTPYSELAFEKAFMKKFA